MFKTMTLALAGLGLTLAACGGATTSADEPTITVAPITEPAPPTTEQICSYGSVRGTGEYRERCQDNEWRSAPEPRDITPPENNQPTTLPPPPAPTTTTPPPPPPPAPPAPEPTEPNYLGATQFVENFVAALQPDLLGGACLVVRTQPERVQQVMRDSLTASPDIQEKAAEYRMPADQFVDMIVVAYGNRLMSECG